MFLFTLKNSEYGRLSSKTVNPLETALETCDCRNLLNYDTLLKIYKRTVYAPTNKIMSFGVGKRRRPPIFP